MVREPDGAEHLMLSDGSRHLQLWIKDGTVLNGPVRLRCTLTGLQEIHQKVLSVRRLSLCCRLRRMPRSLYAPEPQAGRWIDKLRAVDGVNAGASQRGKACCRRMVAWIGLSAAAGPAAHPGWAAVGARWLPGSSGLTGQSQRPTGVGVRVWGERRSRPMAATMM